MKHTLSVVALVLVFAAIALPIASQTEVRGPYVDPGQLVLPWPNHSHYKQPWRGFLETKSGYDFLSGIGINYNAPDHDEVAVRLLAEAGFKTLRIEIGWGSVRWDEKALTNEQRMKSLLQLCKRYGIRPTLLLNAHHGMPCPAQTFNKRLLVDAAKGSYSIKLMETRDIVVGSTGLSNLTEYWASEVIIVGMNAKTGQCELSKPLPNDLKANTDLPMATLKYVPFYPVGTKQFDDTAAGWVRYALLVCRVARDAGFKEFDLEIWNELTFGTKFLDVNNYHRPELVKFEKEMLHEGGHYWELAHRTIDAVKRDYPKVRTIWGFSNTTFFHTKVEELPPHTDGQSYHPYGTATRKLPDQEDHKDQPETNLEAFTPALTIHMPEGWAHTFIQTESLMRLVNPEARKQHPPGTERFYHYITEHGVVPSECGVADEAKGWELKAKCALRSFCMWLNKGIDVLDYFSAHASEPLGPGLLPADLSKLPADAQFEKTATTPMKAMRNLTRAFAGSLPLKSTRQLDLKTWDALGEPRKIFEGDAKHPPLLHRDVFAFLPFQLSEKKFIVAVYVMTYDATQTMPEQRYQLTISNLREPRGVQLYDPMTDKSEVIRFESGSDSVTLEVPVVDYPRLLVIEER